MTNVEKYDMEELSRSITGFDEIAIRLKFLADFTELPGTMTARALLFIALRREGANDSEAFKSVMEMRIDEIEARFEIPDSVREAAEGKARARSGMPPTPTS